MVTFTFLPVPFDSYSNPSNYTFRGSALLTNGTLLNLNGKTVVIEMVNVTIGLFGTMGVSLTFPDGYQAVHPVLNATARHQNAFNEIATPVVVLTYTSLPSLVNPWFTQRAGDSAGVLFDAATGASWTLYVSE